MTFLLLANRGLHRRPGGWTPKELSTLSLWLDADDATTITLSTGVSQWDDKSGNARHMTQATGANQPAWVKGAQNGRAVLRFDGSLSTMAGGDVLDLGTAGLSVVVVGSATASDQHFLGKQTGNNDASGEYRVRRTAFEAYMGSGARSSSYSGTSTLQLYGGVLDRSSGITAYTNGTAGTTVTAGFPDTASAGNGTQFRLGANGNFGASTYVNGDICETVLSLAAWSTDERQKVEGYLAHKWGLTASLPSDHPYKSIAP